MNLNPNPRFQQGFSLVELLIVIAMIGILAAIAIPALSNVMENASQVTAQKRAQNIASMYASGVATGAPAFKGVTSVDGAINAVGIGSAGGGIYAASFFQIPGVSATMDDGKLTVNQAKHYLTYMNGVLYYNPEGGGNSGSSPNPPSPGNIIASNPPPQPAPPPVTPPSGGTFNNSIW